MSKTLLFTFEDIKELESFVKGISSLKKNAVVQKAITTMQKDPNIQRIIALFVSGKKIAEGSFEEINKKFDQEIVAHSGPVKIKEFREGTWKTIRSRK